MKKSILVIITLILTFILASCSRKIPDNEIHIGVNFYPMKDILLLIEDDLESEGFKLKIHEIASLQVANDALKNGELDFNMIQHQYFLESFNNANNSDLQYLLPIYHATFAIYSRKYEKTEDIEAGSTITLPDDSTNLSRALYLLSQAGLITLKDNKTIGLTLEDVLDNPKNLVLTDLVPLGTIAQRYVETELAIMYPTYALSLELEGDSERIYLEKNDLVTENYAIGLAGRSDNQTSDKFKVLSKYLKSDKVRNFLLEEYGYASRPAF